MDVYRLDTPGGVAAAKDRVIDLVAESYFLRDPTIDAIADAATIESWDRDDSDFARRLAVARNRAWHLADYNVVAAARKGDLGEIRGAEIILDRIATDIRRRRAERDAEAGKISTMGYWPASDTLVRSRPAAPARDVAGDAELIAAELAPLLAEKMAELVAPLLADRGDAE